MDQPTAHPSGINENIDVAIQNVANAIESRLAQAIDECFKSYPNFRVDDPDSDTTEVNLVQAMLDGADATQTLALEIKEGSIRIAEAINNLAQALGGKVNGGG